METLLKYIKLYTINEISLNSTLVNLYTNKRYVIAVFKNNYLIRLFVNYKFFKLYYNNYNRFIHNNNCYEDFAIKSFSEKTIALELADDFNYSHLVDLLLTHYNKININEENKIYINFQRCRICKYKIKLSKNIIYYLKS